MPRFGPKEPLARRSAGGVKDVEVMAWRGDWRLHGAVAGNGGENMYEKSHEKRQH
jgi:hypothetical protein